MWVEPDIRDIMIDYIDYIAHKSELSYQRLIRMLGITRSRFYDWQRRRGIENKHNGKLRRTRLRSFLP